LKVFPRKFNSLLINLEFSSLSLTFRGFLRMKSFDRVGMGFKYKKQERKKYENCRQGEVGRGCKIPNIFRLQIFDNSFLQKEVLL
jgi:hypothetical protein